MNSSSLVGYTSSAAKRMIRAAHGAEGVRLFLEHRSPGVRRLAEQTIARFEAPPPVAQAAAAAEDTADPNNLPDFATLAREFGEDSATVVEAIYFAKTRQAQDLWSGIFWP